MSVSVKVSDRVSCLSDGTESTGTRLKPAQAGELPEAAGQRCSESNLGGRRCPLARRPTGFLNVTDRAEAQSGLSGGPNRVIPYFSKTAAMTCRSGLALREIGPSSS